MCLLHCTKLPNTLQLSPHRGQSILLVNRKYQAQEQPLFMLSWFTGCPDPSRATTLISPCKQPNVQCKSCKSKVDLPTPNTNQNSTTHGHSKVQCKGACQVGNLTPVKMARCFRRQFNAAASEFTAVSCTSCLAQMMSSIFNPPIQNTSKNLKLQHERQSSRI